MKRDRTDVLRSITALLGEVNLVAKTLQPVKPKSTVSKPSALHDSMVPPTQVAAITDALLRSGGLSVNGADRNSLELMVAKTFNSAIQSWMDRSLKHVVDEVVEQQLAKLEKQNRRVG